MFCEEKINNFIDEFNKYNIKNITISEYNNRQQLPDCNIDIYHYMQNKFINYNNLYFAYNGDDISEFLYTIKINILKLEPTNTNFVIKYITEKYIDINDISNYIGGHFLTDKNFVN